MQVDWELSRTWTSDGQGVRSLAVQTSPDGSRNDHLWTGTQGGSVVRYSIDSNDDDSALFALTPPHPHAVTAVTVSSDGRFLATGCKDHQLRIFDLTAATPTLVATLPAHEKPVTSLAVATVQGTNFLLTGSWDGTAQLYKFAADQKPPTLVTTLPGHENSVCVTFLPSVALDNLKVATGSAGIAQNNVVTGHAVRIWTIHVPMGTTVGPPLCVADDHQGPIRDILYAHNVLYTCSNDGTIKVRDPTTGQPTATLSFVTAQHPPMLLSLAALRDGTLAASAEDGHVVVWNSGDSAEPVILRHAACVWQVVGYNDTDLLTAADDGTVRLFTRDAARWADETVRQDFAQQAQAAAASSGPTPEEVAKLPAWETNANQRGTSEGQVHLFRKGSVAIAAQWSMASQCWIEVGQVMGNAGGGSGDGGTIDGVAYDHVLPIEVDTTGGQVARLQIGYNTGENPFTAAQRFIDAHMLPQYHLPQIADYISQRVGSGPGPTLGGSAAGAAPPPVAAAGVPTVAYQHLPSTSFVSFGLTAKTVGSLEKMQQKLLESGVLNQAETTALETVMQTLGATNRYHASTLSDADLAIVPTLLAKLQPAAEAFPALDLARVVVLHPDAAKAQRASYWTGVLTQAISLGQQVGEGAAAPVPMLSLRLLANAFVGGPGSLQAVTGLLSDALALCATHSKHPNKNVRLSIATVIYNICHALQQQQQQPPGTSPDAALVAGLLPLVDHILGSRSWEETAVQRTLLALGTLVTRDAAAKGAAQSMYLTAKVELAASPHGALVKEIAKEVYRALQ